MEKSSPRSAFIVLGALFGLLYVFVTPPFESADEPQHLYRAYQVSELRFIGEIAPGPDGPRAGGILPQSLARVAELVMDDLPHNESRHQDLGAVKRALALPLKPHDREFLDFPTNVQYSPVPYAPQALGILLGRLFQAPPLVLLYLARLFNLGTWLLLAALAIRTTPVFRWVFFLLALAPMSIAQAASASADALLNGASFLFLALILEAVFSPRPLSSGRSAAIAALALVVALGKPVYALLPLFILVVPAAKLGSPRKARRKKAALLAGCWGAAAAWSLAVRPLFIPLQPGVSILGQARFLWFHPGSFLGSLVHSATRHLGDHLAEYVGRLGWLDVYLPGIFTILFLAVLCAAALTDKSEGIAVPARLKWAGAGIGAASALLIVTTIDLIWNPVGAFSIEGVQGRYFIPFGPLAFLLLYNLRLPPLLEKFRAARLAAAVFAAAGLGFALYAVLLRYYL